MCTGVEEIDEVQVVFCQICNEIGKNFKMNDDYYFFFTWDQVHEGDGLPDKICSECIQKLSSAFIFKQQCERSDEELRRNYVPPPGFHVTTPPPQPNRQSSDSAFSTHTELSSQTKPSSSTDGAATPAKRSRKRSRESIDDTSVSGRSHDNTITTKRVSELKNLQKRRRFQRSANNSSVDSDYDDNSVSQFSAAETDSDEPLIKSEFKCRKCDKVFLTSRSLSNHMRIHLAKSDNLCKSEIGNIPKNVEAKDATYQVSKGAHDPFSKQ
ncbi:hypothetical protein ACJJTC_018883 [Scirpophaga incertulas]